MKTFLKSIFVSCFLFIVPVLFSPNFDQLIWDIRIWTTFSFSVILLTYQGEIKIKNTLINVKTDKYSTFLIFLFGILSQVFSVTEWIYYFNDSRLNAKAFTIIGLLFLFIGTVIRIDALYKLNKNFTANITEIEKGKLIQHGIFCFIRHPSYLGAYLTMLGTSLFFEAIYTFIFSSISLIIVYSYRIYFEEKQLVKFFKNKYIRYKKSTWKMFPYIW
ncbi:isoprenylcysteine carboxylmethyltransferase family protein [Emticicia sp. W12TSBA100-4]|uniref:methyltransferase family protein n=1 Tax=Emticicia sp. W12TSBA100-4 TaxID=3160965 RepID=UPI003305FD74